MSSGLEIAVLKALDISFKERNININTIELRSKQIRLLIEKYNLFFNRYYSKSEMNTLVKYAMIEMGFIYAGYYVKIDRKHLNNLIKERNTKL